MRLNKKEIIMKSNCCEATMTDTDSDLCPNCQEHCLAELDVEYYDDVADYFTEEELNSFDANAKTAQIVCSSLYKIDAELDTQLDREACVVTSINSKAKTVNVEILDQETKNYYIIEDVPFSHILCQS